jgi:hypothetical protein
LLDFARRVAIEHEELPKMSASGPEQVQSVGFRLGQSLFMAEDDASGVVLNLA